MDLNNFGEGYKKDDTILPILGYRHDVVILVDKIIFFFQVILRADTGY